MGDREHECDFCHKTYSKLWRLREHQCLAHTGERPYVCTHPGCDKAYVNAYRLKRHLASHAEEKPQYKCSHPGCEKVYTMLHNLKRHEKTHFSDIPYKCDVPGCAAAFSKHSKLATHKARHSGPKPFRCTHKDCSAAFDLPSALKRHQKVHQGYGCSEDGCDAVCSTWTEMRKHMASHPKVCPQCGRAFTRLLQLKVHMATHSDSREMFACPREGCDRTYTTLHNLKAHVSSFHEREKPFECSQPGCSAKFSSKCSLQRHLDVVHTSPRRPSKPRSKRSLASKLSGYSARTLTQVSPARAEQSSEEDKMEVTNVAADVMIRAEIIIVDSSI